jgi:anaerobic carbon-monoxide dehydrogenase catalytic subunit
MIAGGAAAHSDHGRCVAEVFMSAARKETDAYKIKDTVKLLAVAEASGCCHHRRSGWQNQLDRDIDEIALEVAEKAMNEWGKPKASFSI